jgi:hypothetical protein
MGSSSFAVASLLFLIGVFINVALVERDLAEDIPYLAALFLTSSNLVFLG